MQTSVHKRFHSTQEAAVAESILRACVHCGFCNATCPTYLELGDERDGPRGRIYLIRQLLETGNATERTRTHLDRCLTCRNCETTCPSGVRYGQLLDIGRGILERDLKRTGLQSIKRRLIQFIVPYPKRFGFVLSIARSLARLMPRSLHSKLPAAQARAAATGSVEDLSRNMIVLDGCAQAAATPATNDATRRVLQRLSIALRSAPGAGCCGALHYHLGEHARGRAFMKRNIDAWWPLVDAGAEAIVITASGCGSTVKEYGELLADDPEYADKARQISAMTRDIAEVLSDEDLESLRLQPNDSQKALHCPCSLQHAQGLGGTLDDLLQRAGLNLCATNESHLCCGSAGSYSLLQPQLSEQLKTRKLAALQTNSPAEILTANVGCQLHLGSGTKLPVRHWIEAIDDALPGEDSSK